MNVNEHPQGALMASSPSSSMRCDGMCGAPALGATGLSYLHHVPESPPGGSSELEMLTGYGYGNLIRSWILLWALGSPCLTLSVEGHLASTARETSTEGLGDAVSRVEVSPSLR